MERAHGSTARNEQLEAVRVEKEWSIEDLAEKVGVHPTTISRWLLGQSFPQPVKLQKLCRAVGKTARELGFGKRPRCVAGRQTTQDTDEAKALKDAETLEQPEAAEQPHVLEQAESLQQSEAPEQSEAIKEPELPTGKEYEDFRETGLALRLFLCVRNYPRKSQARYHELQELIILELRDNQMDINELSRREALKLAAAMPIECCGLSALKPVLKESHDEILLQCGAGITACWGLRKTQDITFAAQTVAKYIPTLKEMTVIGSRQQRREAAELLFQCFLLLSVYSYVVITGAHNAVAYAQQAEKYCRLLH